MNRKWMKKLLAWLALFVWMAVIFYFSHQSGDVSTQISDGVLNTVLSFLPNLFDYAFFSYIIRKFAHFTEYFILEILVYHLMNQYRFVSKKEFIWMILFCVIYAISDEFHQLFIGGRSPKIFDVMIDSLGSCCALALLSFKTKNKSYENS